MAAERRSRQTLGAALALDLYRVIFVPALLALLPRFARQMFRRGGYRESFRTRLGAVAPLPPKSSGRRRIWLHAASVGELLAVGPIIEALHREGRAEWYLSVNTSTAYALAKERFAGQCVGIGYMPLDFWPLSARAWRRVAPDLVVLVEGERWPEHLHQAKRRDVPVVCINARMSERSFRRMLRARALVMSLMGGIDHVLAGSEDDAARFRALGFAEARVRVTGNLKLDLSLPVLAASDRAQLRNELGLGAGLIVLGASTWPGEEAALCELLRRARGAQIDCSLLLVPRHVERRAEIAGLLAGAGLTFHFRSKGTAAGAVEVAVADTTGELRKLTQLADVVFVGRSLPPHVGGQTPVEAAAWEKPVLFGPDMTNFREIAAGLVARGAAQVVHDRDELSRVALELLQSEGARRAMAAAARAWHAANRGAVARTLDFLRRAPAESVAGD